jgi:hypothetical protein
MNCLIDNCDEDLRPGSRLAICEKCRATMHRWRKRSPADVMARRSRLAKYSDRMEKLRGVREPRK